MGSSRGGVEQGSAQAPKGSTPRLGGAPRVPPYVGVWKLCVSKEDSHTPKTDFWTDFWTRPKLF